MPKYSMRYELAYIEGAYQGGRSVIFDLDDTIFPEITFLEKRYEYISKQIFCGSWEEPYQFLLDEFDAEGRSYLFDKLIRRYKLKLSVEDVLKVFRCYDGHFEMSIIPYPWFQKLASRLNKGYPLLLITNGNPDQQRRKLDALNLIDLFPNIVCVFANEYEGKPRIEPFEALGKELKLHNPIYIGDSEIDRAFCVACGIEFFDVKNLLI